MKRKKGYLLSCLLLALTSCGKPEMQVLDARFGTFTKEGANETVFTPAKTLSKRTEPVYGWYVTTAMFSGAVAVKDEVETPVAARWDYPVNAAVKISADGKSISATQTLPMNGTSFLFHNWALSASDPVGAYKARLFVNDRLVKEVSFSVVD